MAQQNWLRGRTLVYNPVPKNIPQPPRFRIGSILLSALRKTCTVIGAFFLFIAVITFWMASNMPKNPVMQLPDKMVMTIDLNGTLPESSGMAQYLSLLNIDDVPMSIDDMVDSIDKAAKDKRVKALVVKSSSVGYDLTQLQQLRAAISRFKAEGKKTYIYAESYGEGGYGLGLYYLASMFDEIWMQPVGTVAIGGINLESPFFKGLMEKYGVEAQFFHRKEYKNAMEHLTSDHMSPASKEMMGALVTNLATQLTAPIKQDRKKITGDFDKLLDLGLLTDKQALSGGLIDTLGYQDDLVDKVQKVADTENLVHIEDYWTSQKRQKAESNLLQRNSATTIAVVHVDGMIVSGSPSSSPYGLEDSVAGADDIAGAIEDAANDDRIKAIVLRVNSPGGSPSASETIARSVQWAITKKNKPVIVSMGPLAASGGYWISAGATKIYALDATLTGSIGVVGGKVNLAEFWKKFDVTWDGVKYGQNAALMSMNAPFSPSEQAQFEATLDSVYDHFIDRVSTGRKMTPAQVEKIAKGHVWTGQEAVKLGLVDRIGGLDVVLDDLAKQYGVPSRDKLVVTHLPADNNPLDMLFQLLSSQSASLPPFLRSLSFLTHMQGAQPLVYDSSLSGLGPQ